MIAVILFAVLAAANTSAQTTYIKEINAWRASHEADLTSDTSWLTLAGLFWLKPGANSVGRGNGADVELTQSFKGTKFGTITLDGPKLTLALAPQIEASIGGKALTGPVDITPEPQAAGPQIDVGSQSFFIIQRGEKFGVRLRDKANPARRAFTGEKWYPADPRYRVTATLEAYDEPKTVLIPNVLGGTFEMKSPGILHFRLNGKRLDLMPVIEDDHLFLIFRDGTSRSQTYGSGRFLYAAMPVDGKVELDFNKAENPPCAFTEFATCPLPPPENRLTVAIPAGEKRYHP